MADDSKWADIVAVPFGADEVSGDSAFYPGRESALPYAGEEFEAVREKYIVKLELDELDEPRPDRGSAERQDAVGGVLDELGGFWVARRELLEEVERIWDRASPGTDSEIYRTNRRCKEMLAGNAICTLRPTISIEDYDLDKRTVGLLIEKVKDEELRNALRVVYRHLGDDPSEDRNEATWGVFSDNEACYGLIFGVYRY